MNPDAEGQSKNGAQSEQQPELFCSQCLLDCKTSYVRYTLVIPCILYGAFHIIGIKPFLRRVRAREPGRGEAYGKNKTGYD